MVPLDASKRGIEGRPWWWKEKIKEMGSVLQGFSGEVNSLDFGQSVNVGRFRDLAVIRMSVRA